MKTEDRAELDKLRAENEELKSQMLKIEEAAKLKDHEMSKADMSQQQLTQQLATLRKEYEKTLHELSAAQKAHELTKKDLEELKEKADRYDDQIRKKAVEFSVLQADRQMLNEQLIKSREENAKVFLQVVGGAYSLLF